MQSKFTISTVEYNINIINYNEQNTPIINEYTTIIDPSNYDADNSVLVASGRKKHEFYLTGWCTIAHRAIYIAALRNSTKVYPVIYPGAGSTNVIETSSWYYFKSLTGNFMNGNDTFWYNMSLIWGGV